MEFPGTHIFSGLNVTWYEVKFVLVSIFYISLCFYLRPALLVLLMSNFPNHMMRHEHVHSMLRLVREHFSIEKNPRRPEKVELWKLVSKL